MKNNEILDLFGKKVISECFDAGLQHFDSLREKKDPPFIFKEKVEFLKSLDEDSYQKLRGILKSNFELIMFEFLKFLEEDERFKLLFMHEGTAVNLFDISEDLKSEHLSEGGWIERFSQEFKSDDFT